MQQSKGQTEHYSDPQDPLNTEPARINLLLNSD